MKRFIATERNINQIMGEMNKVFMKNNFWGHHVVVGSFNRKNGKRPKMQHIAGQQKYFFVLAERTDPMFLCDINHDTEEGFDYLTVISDGDTILIDSDRVHIISKDEWVKVSRQKKLVVRTLRKYYSFIPATEATAQTQMEHLEEMLDELDYKN